MEAQPAEAVRAAPRGTFVWHKLEAKGSVPPPVCCHTLVPYKERYLVLFGGGVMDFVYKDVQMFDTLTNTWRYVEVENEELVQRRMSHSAVIYGERLLVYGGQSCSAELIDDCVELDLETRRCRTMPASDDGPGPRRLHTCVRYRNRMYLLMGEPCARENSLFYLDLDTYRWHRVTPQSTYDAESVQVGRSALREAEGGGAGAGLQDGGEAAPRRGRRRRSRSGVVDEEPSPAASPTSSLRSAGSWDPAGAQRECGRSVKGDGGSSLGADGWPVHVLRGHSAAVEGDYMYVFGGFYRAYAEGAPDPGGQSVYTAWTYRYHFPTNTWQELGTASALKPPPRYALGLAVYNGVLTLYGGDINCTDGYYDDVWRLDVRDPGGQWQNCTSSTGPSRPCARSGHASAVVNGALYIHGGEVPNSQHSVGYSSAMYRLPLALPVSASLLELASRWLARTLEAAPDLSHAISLVAAPATGSDGASHAPRRRRATSRCWDTLPEPTKQALLPHLPSRATEHIACTFVTDD